MTKKKQPLTEALEIGDRIPDISLIADNGESINLSDFSGKFAVLYFYPKDDTPGCTKEANDFSCRIKDFQKKNTVILGVSRDPITSHQRFKDKYNIPYLLLADTDEALCNHFGVIKNKNMYGKQVRGIERSTFLIGKDGAILKIWRKVDVPGHVDDVLASIAELTTPK